MKEVLFLIIGPRGIKGIRKTRPSLKYNEVSAKMTLEIPPRLP